MKGKNSYGSKQKHWLRLQMLQVILLWFYFPFEQINTQLCSPICMWFLNHVKEGNCLSKESLLSEWSSITLQRLKGEPSVVRAIRWLSHQRSNWKIATVWLLGSGFRVGLTILWRKKDKIFHTIRYWCLQNMNI